MHEAVQMPGVSTSDGPRTRGQDALSQLDVLLLRRFESAADAPKRDGICLHWPLDGTTKIHAASLSLTGMAGLFVEDFDQRWRVFRDRIASVVALSKDAAH